MLTYLLDTDTVSFILRAQGPAASRLTAHQPSEIAISSLTLAELRFGAERRRSRKLHGVIDTFIRTIQRGVRVSGARRRVRISSFTSKTA